MKNISEVFTESAALQAEGSPLFKSIYDVDLSPQENYEKIQAMPLKDMWLELFLLSLQVTKQAEQIAALKHIAETDKLTSVYNRHHFEHVLERTVSVLHGQRDIKEERRTAVGTHLLIIDLDGFKQINDRQGHETGDVVLQTVAQSLAMATRNNDTVARLGGDEFAVILTGTNEEGAEKAKQRIMSGLEALNYSHDGVDYKIKTSVGSVEITPGMTSKEAMRAADKVMYKIKKEKGVTRNMPPERIGPSPA